MSRKRDYSVTDWQWYDACEICDAQPGEACVDLRQRLTATIRGRTRLSRPHKERRKLERRLVPFLSEGAREYIPEILDYLAAYRDASYAEHDSYAGRANTQSRDAINMVSHLLSRAANAVPTTRAEASWPDREAAER
ncbi:zinc finger domain-containing protein [Amycolatopsis anabasis]|uniref:zinc finger domain-containing protein n=1 Tax=Amycolatopsis anabasis TaxID=1840409 RepID=UPI003CCD6A38